MIEHIENAEILAEIKHQSTRTLKQMALVRFEDDVAALVALGMGDRDAFQTVKLISRSVLGVI